jgi:phosphatidylserine/phosphatidylglycerophosphate/cardiolipin synthase-like enzyme
MMMHAKTVMVDVIWRSIGSSSFVDRFFRLNDEVNVNVYDEDNARSVPSPAAIHDPTGDGKAAAGVLDYATPRE